MPQSDSQDPGRQQKLERILAEYLHSVEKGRPLGRAELINANPDLASDLKEFFRNHDSMDRIAEPMKAAADLPTIIGWVEESDTTIGEKIRYFGDYELSQEIARGGMGIVYKARQVSLNRTVALKMILAGQLASSDGIERFHREAEAAANLDHPNIVPIYEVGMHESQHYFSMKFIDGKNLSQPFFAGGWPNRNRENQKRLIQIIAKVARAVHHAHQRGILHRDLKPGNILIDSQGQPHVSDFGLAKHLEKDDHNTRTGSIIGTPSYMAPEQARMEKVLTTAVDVYGLGAILYEVLTGRPPFRAETPLDTLRQVIDREPESPCKVNPDVDLDLGTICLKCLEKDRERRYDSAASLATDLERWCSGETIQARPAGMVERWQKWIRRKPLQAAVIGLLVGSTTLIVSVVSIASWRVYSQEKVTVQAKTARDEAVDVAKLVRYVQSAAVVERTVDFGEPYIADRRLTKMDPQLRSWEWNALQRRTRAELQHLVMPPQIETRYGFESSTPQVLSQVTLLAGSPDVAVLKSSFASRGVGELTLWNSQTAKLDRSFSDVYEPLAISTQCQWFASPEPINAAVAIRDLSTGQMLETVSRENGYLQSLVCSPEGTLLAISTGSDEKDSVVVIWDVESRSQVSRITNLRAAMKHLAFGPGGRQLAMASQTAEELGLWDVRTGNEVNRFERPGQINQLQFSPRGDLLASTSSGRVTVWDIKSGTRRKIASHQRGRDGQTFEKQSEIIGSCIAFSPDGSLLASAGVYGTMMGSNDSGGGNIGTVCVSDVDTRQRIFDLSGKIGLPGHLSFSPDGRSLAWSHRESSVTICNFERLRTENTIRGRGTVAVSPDGQLVAHSDGRLSIYDTRHGRLIRPPFGNVNFSRPLGVAFSHDGKRVAGGLSGPGLPIWDLATGKAVASIKNSSSAFQIAFSPDDRLVLYATSHSVCVCDVATGNLVFDTMQHTKGNVYCGAFSSDGKRIVTGGLPENQQIGRVIVWDVATWKPILRLEGLYTGATSVAWNPQGTLIAACAGVPADDGSGRRNGNPHEVLVWDANTGEERLRLDGHASDVNAVLFTPDGQRLLTASADRTVKLWDVKLGLEVMTLHRATVPIVSLATSQDGSIIAAGGDHNTEGEDRNNRVWVWDASPQKPAPEGFRYPLLEVSAGWSVNDMVADLSGPLVKFKVPNGGYPVMTADLTSYLVTNEKNGVTIYDAKTGDIAREVEGLKDSATALAVSGDGRIVAVANGPMQQAGYNYDPKTGVTTQTVVGNDGPGEVRVWNRNSGQIRSVFRSHTQPVTNVAVSPDGGSVVSVSAKDRVLHLWDAETAEIRASFAGQFRNPVFASDCQRFITIRSASPDGQPANDTVIFDANTAQIINTIRNPPAGTMKLWFGPNGDRFIRNGPKTTGLWAPAQASQIQIVDVQSGNVEHEIEEPHDLLLAAAFGPGPKQLTTVNGNQVVRIWDLTTRRPIRTYNHEQIWLQQASLSRGARRIAFLSYETRTVQVWDINRLSILQE